MSQGSADSLAGIKTGIQAEIEELNTEEARILKARLWFIPTTTVRRMIVYYFPRKRFLDTKEQLQTTVTSKKTDLRIGYLAVNMEVLLDNFSDNKEYRPSLDKIIELMENPDLNKWHIRWAARELKLLKTKILHDPSIENKDMLLLRIAEIRAVLGDEFEDRYYQLKLEGKMYVKRKTHLNDRRSIYNVFFWLRQAHKTLDILLFSLAFIATFLVIIGFLFFPPLLPPLVIILAILSIGICYCTIVLSLERFIKWTIDRAYFNLPFTTAQLISGIIGFVNVILSIVFIVLGVFAFIPGAGTTFAIPNFPSLGSVVNSVINFANTLLEFINIHYIAYGVSKSTIYAGYLIIAIYYGILYLKDLGHRLIDHYKKKKIFNVKQGKVSDPKLEEKENSGLQEDKTTTADHNATQSPLLPSVAPVAPEAPAPTAPKAPVPAAEAPAPAESVHETPALVGESVKLGSSTNED